MGLEEEARAPLIARSVGGRIVSWSTPPSALRTDFFPELINLHGILGSKHDVIGTFLDIKESRLTGFARKHPQAKIGHQIIKCFVTEVKLIADSVTVASVSAPDFDMGRSRVTEGAVGKIAGEFRFFKNMPFRAQEGVS